MIFYALAFLQKSQKPNIWILFLIPYTYKQILNIYLYLRAHHNKKGSSYRMCAYIYKNIQGITLTNIFSIQQKRCNSYEFRASWIQNTNTLTARRLIQYRKCVTRNIFSQNSTIELNIFSCTTKKKLSSFYLFANSIDVKNK